MPFFMVDDKLHINRKITEMIESEPLSASGQAMMLWTLGGSLTQDKGTDGVLTTGDLTRLFLNRSAALKAARMLVKHGLWHAPGHDCEDCPQPPDGGFVFHHWGAMGYSSGAQVRVARERRKELKNPELVESVWARDTGADGVAHCRYCGVKVSRHDRKSDRRPTIDHVIPGIAKGVENLVLACFKCNREKGQRTPEQAGMKLLPPPGSSTESNPESNRSEFDPDLISALPHAGARGHGQGQGQGQGSSRGLGTGRRRGPAGAAPKVPAVDRFGSPWHGARPHGDPPVEGECSVHGLPAPCRRCAAEVYDVAEVE